MPHLHLRDRLDSEVQRKSTLRGLLHPRHRVVGSHTRQPKASHTTPTHTPDTIFSWNTWESLISFNTASRMIRENVNWNDAAFPRALWVKCHAFDVCQCVGASVLLHAAQQPSSGTSTIYPQLGEGKCVLLLFLSCDWGTGLLHRHKLMSCTHVLCI